MTFLPEKGATSHVTSDPNIMEFFKPYPSSSQVVLGNSNALPISSTFTLNFLTLPCLLYLNHILIVPQLIANLLSIAMFVKDNYCLIKFNPLGYVVKEFLTKIPLIFFLLLCLSRIIIVLLNLPVGLCVKGVFNQNTSSQRTHMQ